MIYSQHDNSLLTAELLRERFMPGLTPGTLDSAVPSHADITYFHAMSTQDIVQFLTASHRLYDSKLIPEIERLFHLAKTWDSSNLTRIHQLFVHLIADLHEHFMLEEDGLFSYAIELESNPSSTKLGEAGLWQSLADHHDAPEKDLVAVVDLLNKLSDQYANASLLRRLIWKVGRLITDLTWHARIEDEVLIPRIAQLESEL